MAAHSAGGTQLQLGGHDQGGDGWAGQDGQAGADGGGRGAQAGQLEYDPLRAMCNSIWMFLLRPRRRVP